jgi:hypothetical protein
MYKGKEQMDYYKRKEIGHDAEARERKVLERNWVSFTWVGKTILPAPLVEPSRTFKNSGLVSFQIIRTNVLNSFLFCSFQRKPVFL